MHPNEYQALALRTMADQETIRLRNLQYGKQATQIDNAVRGLANDVGEIAEAVKNWLEYGKPFDPVNLNEEVGDVLWRLAQLCDACGFALEQAMEANIRKLQARYPDKYSDAQADPANRNRAAERASLMGSDSLEAKFTQVAETIARKRAAAEKEALDALAAGLGPTVCSEQGFEPDSAYTNQDGPQAAHAMTPPGAKPMLTSIPEIQRKAAERLAELKRCCLGEPSSAYTNQDATPVGVPPTRGAHSGSVLPQGIKLNHAQDGFMCAVCKTPVSDEVPRILLNGGKWSCPECRTVIGGRDAESE